MLKKSMWRRWLLPVLCFIPLAGLVFLLAIIPGSDANPEETPVAEGLVPTATETVLPSETPLPTATPIPTETPLPSPTSTPEPTLTPTDLPTLTPSATATSTPTVTPSPTAVGPALLLLSPQNGAIEYNMRPELRWQAVGGATSYTYQLDDQSDFSSLRRTGTTSNTAYLSVELADSVWYWRVRANFGTTAGEWSPTWQFDLQAYPVAPMLMAPVNRGTVPTALPTFEWQTGSDVTQFMIEVHTDSSFSGTPYLSATVNSPTFMPDFPLSNALWYWRVKGYSPTTNSWGRWSAVWRFTIAAATPTYTLAPSTPTPLPTATSTPTLPPPTATTSTFVPVLIAPANGAIEYNMQPRLQWQAVTGATSYTYQIDNNADFSSPRKTGTTSSLSYLSVELADEVWYWRVRAHNGTTAGEWSVIWQFEVQAYPLPPVLSAPANYGTVTTALPVFSWEPAADATQYLIQVHPSISFSGTPYLSATLDSTSFTPTAPLSGHDLWYWRVKAYSPTTNSWGKWSPIRRFTIVTATSTPSPTPTVTADPTCGPIRFAFAAFEPNAVVRFTLSNEGTIAQTLTNFSLNWQRYHSGMFLEAVSIGGVTAVDPAGVLIWQGADASANTYAGIEGQWQENFTLAPGQTVNFWADFDGSSGSLETEYGAHPAHFNQSSLNFGSQCGYTIQGVLPPSPTPVPTATATFTPTLTSTPVIGTPTRTPTPRPTQTVPPRPTSAG